MKRGLLVGRFQPLHKGHVSAIESALADVDELIIGVGSSQFGYSQKNPFTFEERVAMIEGSLKGNYIITAIPDIHEYSKWVEHVEKLCPSFDVVYTGSPITRRLFEEKGYNVRDIRMKKIGNSENRISATHIRELIASGDPSWKEVVPEATLSVMEKCSGETRIYHLERYADYPKATLTVDTIARYGEGIVLIRRDIEPFKGMFALPGGHVNLGEAPEDAAKRELKEETGLDVDIKGITKVYARLGRDPRGYTASITYHGVASGELKAGDDAADVLIVELCKLPAEMAFNHREIIDDYLKVRKNAD